MSKMDKRKLTHIILAIVLCALIVAIPLTVKLVADSKAGSDVVVPNVPSEQEDVDVKPNAPAESEYINVTISIECHNLFKAEYSSYLEDIKKRFGDKFNVLEGGKILDTTTVRVKSGTTVMDVTKLVADKNDIPLDIVGGTYIKSIMGLSEKMAGGQSGWMYSLNGGFALGANSVVLNDGDSVVWWYTVTPRDTMKK